MKVRLYRCEEPDCEAAFLSPLQLRGHRAVHAKETRAVAE